MAVPLNLLDQAAYRAQNALDSVVLAQVSWLADGPPDVDRVRALAARLARSRQLGRVIVPAAAFGGRDHWGPLDAVPEVAVVTDPVERSAVPAWLDDRAQMPVDPCRHPWHLAVRPLAGGGHAVTLVVSHALTDGIGLVNVLAAADGDTAALYRGRRPGLLTAIGQAAAGLPGAVRAAATAARADRGTVSPAPTTSHARPLTAVALIHAGAWHSAAAAAGATSNALFVSVAAQVAVAAGRVTADGRALIGMPVNSRGDGDDVSANALTTVQLDLPADRVGDVAFVRAEVKRTLAARREQDASFTALLPLVPYLPRKVVRAVAQAALGGGDPVTSASHVGVVPPALVAAPGPAYAVVMNLAMQHPAGVAGPDRVNAVIAETPGGTVAVHLSAASDGIGDAAVLRSALAGALRSSHVEPRELL
ncbi:hypothetical protein ACFQO7_11480 [Catellatospora aurea]|uniref:Diacylglycerol O-acyltransferase n=1 Tax=Catellatospora aurea TaxID=1337874 RepID=A0ABW2GWA6_9ACTN